MTELTQRAHHAATRHAPGDHPAAGRHARPARPGVVLTIVLVGQLMAVIDNSIVNVAVPSMAAGLHASGALLQLIVAGYTISYAVLLVTGARLGDILGHRRVFLAGAALFTLASLGCGLSPTAGALVGLRFIQGAGAADHDPAGAQPDPADLHRARPAGAGDEPVRGGAVRRRRARPGRRRAAGQRRPVRCHVAADLPGQRARRAGGARLRAAAACRRLRSPAAQARPAGPGDPHARRARVRPAACSRPVAGLARLGLGAARAGRAARRRPRPGRAPGPRPRRAADPAALAAGLTWGSRRDRRDVRPDGDLRRLALHAHPAPAGRPRVLAAALRSHLRPRCPGVRLRQPELAARAGRFFTC